MSLFVSGQSAHAQAEPFIGQIMWVGFSFCPRGWMDANGQILSIAQNTALFSLYGTTYGGNGQTTFALPDLRGRVQIHTGQGPGLSQRDLGQLGGAESVTLSANQMPAHNHFVAATTGRATTNNPDGASIASSGGFRAGSTNVALQPGTIGITGGSQPHENMPPFITMRACVAIEGVYPPRP